MSLDTQHTDERWLFRQIAEGDEAAFERIYRAYVPQLASFLKRFSVSDREVDEIIQETFLRVWLQRDKLPEVEFPKAWVFRISSNIIFNYMKRSVTEENAKNVIGGNAQHKHNDTEETLHLHQLMAAIARAVENLSPQRKRIYELSRHDGLTIPEIAEKLGLSNNTVKNTLTSSLQLIREFLQEHGYDINYFLLLSFTTYIGLTENAG
ncbi:RNA polymerase sigma factor [Pseudoflavitalea rhizosphaerae]|uniref:RNA polymerase sigma factor n=1 Tax=Pseudoflavitalea rhizosphaerae TaxID=1884793 RepID=UPI000F8E7938|nr:sigma-70 family RNA polymerase sigma factor [Pseudoflavitalea rhizosphaerae]